MKRTLSSRFVAAAVLAVAAFGAASVAQARPEVQVTIGLPIFVAPPFIVRTEPAYAEPRPFYVPPRVVYERPGLPVYRPGFERGREWRHDEWKWRERERRDWERREWERRDWDHRQHPRFQPQGGNRD